MLWRRDAALRRQWTRNTAVCCKNLVIPFLVGGPSFYLAFALNFKNICPLAAERRNRQSGCGLDDSDKTVDAERRDICADGIQVKKKRDGQRLWKCHRDCIFTSWTKLQCLLCPRLNPAGEVGQMFQRYRAELRSLFAKFQWKWLKRSWYVSTSLKPNNTLPYFLNLLPALKRGLCSWQSRSSRDCSINVVNKIKWHCKGQ